MLKTLLQTTILSIGLFFSISFISILVQIHPFHERESGSLLIGFPFTFYEEFRLKGNGSPNFGWQIPGLLYDCMITWFSSFIFVRFYRLKHKRQQ